MATGMVVIPDQLLATPSAVRMGAISDSFRGISQSAEEILGYLQTLELETVELMGDVVEAYAGAPSPGPSSRHPESMTLTERSEYVRSRAKAYGELRKWRLGVSMNKFVELGEMYRDAGVDIEIINLANPNRFEDEIIYAYRVAQAIGARGMSFELSSNSARRMAPYAMQYEILNSMHNHLQVAQKGFNFDEYLAHSPSNMLNLDIGHYVAALGISPISVIKKYHDRITHLHLKDHHGPEHGQESVPWGTGETPIREVLQLLRDEAYPISAMIELDYPIPEGSTVMKEISNCVAYCRESLES